MNKSKNTYPLLGGICVFIHLLGYIEKIIVYRKKRAYLAKLAK